MQEIKIMILKRNHIKRKILFHCLTIYNNVSIFWIVTSTTSHTINTQHPYFTHPSKFWDPIFQFFLSPA